MLRNQPGQRVYVFVYNFKTNDPMPSVGSSLTAYVVKDHGDLTPLMNNVAVELDSNLLPGRYYFDLDLSETDANNLIFMCRTTTPDCMTSCIPKYVQTQLADALDAQADAILTRDWSQITVPVPNRCMLNALRKLRNRWTFAKGVLTIYLEDDATVAYTQNAATTPGAAPVTSVSG